MKNYKPPGREACPSFWAASRELSGRAAEQCRTLWWLKPQLFISSRCKAGKELQGVSQPAQGFPLAPV